MKSIYKILILGIVCLISNSTFSQFEINPNTNNNSVIPKTGAASDCPCNYPSDYDRFLAILGGVEGEARLAKLREQEGLLKTSIEQRLGKNFDNFTEAQRALFGGSFVGNQDDEILRKESIRVYSAYNAALRNKVSLLHEEKVIKNRQNTNDVKPFGDLRTSGAISLTVKDMTPDQIRGELRSLNIRLTREGQKASFNSQYSDGIAKIGRSGDFEARMIDDYINHYNSFSFEDRIKVMTKYLIMSRGFSINNANALRFPPLPLDTSTIDYTDIALRMAFREGTPSPPTTPSTITIRDALRRLSIVNLGDRASNFVSSNPNLLLATQDYLEENTYVKESLSLTRDLMWAHLNGTGINNESLIFTHNQAYPPNHPIILYPIATSLDGNIVRSWNISDKTIIKPMDGFLDLVEAFNGTLHPNAEGSLIRMALPQTPTWSPDLFTNENLAEIFDVRGFDALGGYPFGQLVFEHNIGEILGNNGFIHPLFFRSDFALQAALSIAENNGSAENIDFKDQIILDPSVSPCLKEILRKLKLRDTHGSVNPDIPNGGNEHIAQIILDLFDNDPTYTLYITEAIPRDIDTNNPLPNVNGQHIYVPETKTMFIRINPKLVEKGTDLAIAKTIIHESMHAWISYNFQVRNENFVLTLNALLLKLQIANPNNSDLESLTHHEFIGQVHGALAQSLAAWDFHKKPRKYYEQMSWGGLQTSSAYLALTETERTKIINILNNERTGNNDALGERCP